jgi:hypothetical protein
MNKRNLKILVVLNLAGVLSSLTAREFRTPLPLERGYAFSHYPFARFDYQNCKDDCKWLYVDIWGAGWHKNANFAFVNKDSTTKTSLSGLFFGAESFTVGQALVPGSVPSAFPLINALEITPAFDYNEDGAIFGAFIETRVGCEDEWGIGFRARIPFRSVKAALDSCCNLEESAEDLFILDNERLSCTNCTPPSNPVIQTIVDAFALRLDVASALFQQQSGITPFEPLVSYGTATADTTISTVNVTDANNNPIYLIYSANGAQPVPPFSETQPEVNALPFLNGAGTNTTNARFETGVDYTALAGSPAAQRNFWVAPTILTNSGGELDVKAAADFIRSNVEQLLQFHSINNRTPVGFLLANGLSFDTARNNGIGNIDTEIYARYDGCICNGIWFAEGIFGARYPTDTRITTTNQLLLVPTGNNHHYEVKLGGYVGIQPCEWFAVKADAWYYWALKHREIVNAPFTGSTVTNIGPGVCANVSWQYFVGDIDFTFLVPCICDYIGFDVGYQAWVKRRDHVSLNVTSAVDFFGVTQPLNPCLLESDTKRVAHTVKAEIFKQCCNWQVFAGWNHTFAGKNALNDSDWYLGLVVYF